MYSLILLFFNDIVIAFNLKTEQFRKVAFNVIMLFTKYANEQVTNMHIVTRQIIVRKVKLLMTLSEKSYNFRRTVFLGFLIRSKSSDEYGVYMSHNFLNQVIGMKQNNINPDNPITNQKQIPDLRTQKYTIVELDGI